VSAPGSDRSAGPGLDELMIRLRQRVAAQHRRGGRAPAETAPPTDALVATLRQAEKVADIGGSLPPFGHLSRPRRAVARLAGRLTLYFLRLITVDQQMFNHLVLRVAEHLRGRLEELGRTATRTEAALTARVAAQDLAIRAANEGAARLRSQMTERDRLLLAMLRELPDSGGDAMESMRSLLARESPEAAGSLDALGFEESFRGDAGQVAERQRPYVSLFQGRQDVLDIGCGRGEFIELLREAGIRARGVDIDRDMALWCQEKGLDVEHGDALAYLSSLPDASLGGVFCAQVIEHLHTGRILRLMQMVARKIRPGGVLVVETLNPECLLVHYRWFWMDLTHVRLVHPQTLKFLFGSCGFGEVECRFLPPPEPPFQFPPLPGHGEELQRFNDAAQMLGRMLFSSYDYVVTGTRRTGS
jgi:SAM-dependent methyltransferase